MIVKIITAIIACGVIALNYFYCDAQRNGPTPKSMTLKMIGATGYLSVGLLCIQMTGEFSAFDKAMVIALVFSWLGDLFLHISKKICVAIGFLMFLTSHFCFIRAYLIGINLLSANIPEKKLFALWEIIVIIGFVIFFAIFMLKRKMATSPFIFIPVIIYGGVITTMLCKACVLGYTAFNNGIGLPALICAGLGALLFVMSDFSISILMFDKTQKKNFKLKLFNMYTYFAAEILLASLIYFI